MKELTIIGKASESFVMQSDKAMLQVDGSGRYEVQASVDGLHWSVYKTISASCAQHSRTVVIDLLQGVHIRVLCVMGQLERVQYTFTLGKATEEIIESEHNRVVAEGERVIAEKERVKAEEERNYSESIRADEFVENEARREETFAENEARREKADDIREQTFMENEAKRQLAFENNEFNRTPLLRYNSSNEMEVSYDSGNTWSVISAPLESNIRISRYVDSVESLPSTAAVGSVYGVKDATYTSENPRYRIYVQTDEGWVDNGVFTSVLAGVVQTTGGSENDVMSQDAVTKQLYDCEDISSQCRTGYYNFSTFGIGEVTEVTAGGSGAWKSIAIQVQKGQIYKISGVGGNASRQYAVLDTNNVIQDISEAGAVVTDKVISIDKAGTLYCNFDVHYNISIEKYVAKFGKIDERVDEITMELSQLDKEVKDIANTLYEEVVVDLTGNAVKGVYKPSTTAVGEVVEITKSGSGAWYRVDAFVKKGDVVSITGVGGASSRLYIIVDTNNVLRKIAPSGDSQNGLKINIDTDGIIYCNFDYSVPFSLKISHVEFSIPTGGDTTEIHYGFGDTCDCDYTSPDIPPYSLPSEGNGRCNYIYSLYDELMARYPQYIIKEDCDAVMQSLGVTKPSAISHLPIYMYKFIAPRTPNNTSFSATTSDASRIKALITTGTHNEYTAIWDCYHTMRLVCESWASDKNLEELRWNADIYIIPCYNPYGVEMSTRQNENGIDLNRNAPTSEWKPIGNLGDSTYSGSSAGSEYSTKMLIHYLGVITPQVFIDHHNSNVGSGTDEGEGKNMIYVTCKYQVGVDIASVIISQMTRKWKVRYADTFPSVESQPNVLFGYTKSSVTQGTLGLYGAENGALGYTYESNRGILYKNGIYSTDNRQHNTVLVNTCATEGFINFLVRTLKVYSQGIGRERI